MDIKLLVCPQSFSHVQFFVTPWTVAHQAPISMGFSRQEYWSGLPFPTAGDLLDPVIEHESLASPAMAGRFFTTVPPGNPYPIIGRSSISWSESSDSSNTPTISSLLLNIKLFTGAHVTVQLFSFSFWAARSYFPASLTIGCSHMRD